MTYKDMILQLFCKHGLLADKNIRDTRLREKLQKKQETQFHNTELLLKNYKNISWMIEFFPDTIAEELEQSFSNVDQMIDKLDVELSIGNRNLENRLESLYKTRCLLDRVNEALTVLQKKPEDGERLYKLIYLTYIAPETLTRNQIIYRLDISLRQYYRLKEQAINIISIRLWSAPNKDIEFCNELFSIMEETNKKIDN